MTNRLKTCRRVLLGLVVVAAIYAFLQMHADKSLQPTADRRESFETVHYVITTSATMPQTKQVAHAVESLHAQYMAFFKLPVQSGAAKLRLTLYRDRDEFKRRNPGVQWAEAFYRAPDCHAYFAADKVNPYHWMIHEATHQLNHEVARVASEKWINEGLATYFGSSMIENGKLVPGRIDVNTYPVWGVARLTLTGDPSSDIDSLKIVGLRALVSGVGGPDINEKFNTYYIGYWSLTHFLFHFEQGKYAQSYRQLIAAGGSVDNFERLIGPIEQVQAEWYSYLAQQAADIRFRKTGNANS